MWLKFSKMHGAGNDFVVIDQLESNVELTDELVRKICHRQTGIGCDQLLVISAPNDPSVDLSYQIFNADGGQIEQCGNGARCFAHYVHERNLCGRNPLRVKTMSGKYAIYREKNSQYRVDMGLPNFELTTVPFVSVQNNQNLLQRIDDLPSAISACIVSMGNPHAVIQVDDVDTSPVEEIGSTLQNHPQFPSKVNVGFMQVQGKNEISLRVFERGSGETLACGSGACAAVVAGISQHLLESPVKVNLAGGTLTIQWNGINEHVQLTGPAVFTFHGQIKI